MVRRILLVVLFANSWITAASADDWPSLGRDRSRNSVSPERNPPLSWQVKKGSIQAANAKIETKTEEDRNIRWSADFHGRAYGSPIVSQGLVWIGTSYWEDDKKPGGMLRCFRESDRATVYERCSDPLPLRVHDSGWTGIGGSPLVEGDHLWYVTNRWEVVCLDIGPLLRSVGPPKERWIVDMVKEFGVFPRATVMGPPRHCSIAPSLGDRIFVTTGNGTDDADIGAPAPKAPALVCLDKNNGKALWTDRSPGGNVHCTEASSPLVAEIAGRTQVIVPQGDGWLRSFDPTDGKILWSFDLNRKETILISGGPGTRNFSWSSPVLYENRIYVTTGQMAENGEGPGRLLCVDPTKSGDISSELAVDHEGKQLPQRRVQAVIAKDGERAIPNPNSGLVWELDSSAKEFERQYHRSLSSVAIHDGLLITTDLSGLVHCLDARTGKWHWSHDLFAASWTNPLIVNGHIFVTDEDGDVTILRLSADPKVAIPTDSSLLDINVAQSIYASPVFANGTLYVATVDKLYAIGRGREPRAPKSPFVPTPHDVIVQLLKVAKVTDKDLVVDLGSGDGRILIAAAKSSGARAIGLEIDPKLVELSRDKIKQEKLDKLATVQEKDFYAADWSEASVVTAFLYPSVLEKLRPQFSKLKAGTRIVTHTFEIPGVKPDEVVEFKLPEGDLYRIYLYKCPVRAPSPPPKP
jgi:outer membrane protein assembly factor BamB